MQKSQRILTALILFGACLKGSSQPALVLDSTFKPVVTSSGFVSGVWAQRDGKILVAGGFSTVNSIPTPQSDFARLNRDGTLDRQFIPPAINMVMVTGPNGFARLNIDGTVDTEFGARTGGWTKFGYAEAVSMQRDGFIIVAGHLARSDG